MKERYLVPLAVGFSLLTAGWAGVPATVHNFAHIGDGEGIRTVFLVINQNDRAADLTLSLIGDDGAPLELTIGSQTASSFEFAVSARGTLRISTSGASEPIRQGWARLVSDIPVGAQLLFEIRTAAGLITQAAIESSPPLRAVDLFVEGSSQTMTGFAAANLSGSGSTRLRLTLVDGDGEEIQTTHLTLGPLAHRSLFASQLFSGLNEISGSLRVRSSGPVAIITLQQTGLVLGTLANNLPLF